MPFLNSHHKTPLTVILIAGTVLAFTMWASAVNQAGFRTRVLPTVTSADNVQVQARVNGCTLEIIALPEKRIPAVNNWDTTLNVSVVDSGNQQVANFNTNTNNQGYSITNLCDLGVYPPAGDYDYYIRGLSHLRRAFSDQSSFNFYNTFFNFSSSGTLLLAGDTGASYDNTINSLDLSTMINTFDTANTRSDLNQDGRVNSLDISNAIYNFYRVGE